MRVSNHRRPTECQSQRIESLHPSKTKPLTGKPHLGLIHPSATLTLEELYAETLHRHRLRLIPRRRPSGRHSRRPDDSPSEEKLWPIVHRSSSRKNRTNANEKIKMAKQTRRSLSKQTIRPLGFSPQAGAPREGAPYASCQSPHFMSRLSS